MLPEITTKHQRLVQFMTAQNISNLVLTSRANFSWLSAGKLSFVNGAADAGVAALVVTRDKITCVTTNIEQTRIAQEELSGSGIDVLAHPWQLGSERAKVIAGLLTAGPVGYDLATAGLPAEAKPLPGDFSLLRWSLLPEEIERYELAGAASSRAMEQTVRQIKPGMTESEIAGLAAANIWSQSTRPWVLLIAADDRIKKFRHPIPTDNKLQKTVEVVFCVEKFGLICSLTRIVSFGPVDADLRKRHDAVAAVDAAVNLHSAAGKTLGEMFDFITRQYERVGYPGEWQLHHQGGTTGYLTRDKVATPGDATKLATNQALAWNPSITGTKSEDTVIATPGGPIVVTAAGKEWPMINVEFEGKTLPRPDILVVQ